MGERSVGAASREREINAGMRRLLYLASVLVVLAAGELYLLTDHTERFFAWTIAPGLTAAFLGAGYLAAFSLEFLSARERIWARARMAVPGVLVFTVLTLIATLRHLDKFHFHSSHPMAWLSTWGWLAIYTVVPVLMVMLLIVQWRSPGGDPPRRTPVPRWGLAVVGLQGAAMLALGSILFFASARGISIWPWKLTPLTSQAMGAWLLGIGLGAAHMLWERDFERIAAAAVAYTLFGAFETIALARYVHDVDWRRPGAWIYLGFLCSVLAVGTLGWAMARHQEATRLS